MKWNAAATRRCWKNFGFTNCTTSWINNTSFGRKAVHPQQIRNEEMMLQKLDYMHNNPLQRGYVDKPVHWRYSSARNYARMPSLIDVITDWR